ncbi:MAG: triphosphoribosyl-dephospho-CoA synthase [Alphaproteobacteria bacterium]|nr:triphosphoribosyl-dephospho-CoA synthase [Alphaproteobacteria bacterium]
MTFPLSPDVITEAFLTACKAELSALKPGNVHVHAGGHDMDVAHFERAAKAAAPHIARKGMKVGHRIRSGVDASLAAAGCNTNLGIIMLCAPLAYAAGEVMAQQSLSGRLGRVLAGLDQSDAEQTFQAIASANPGGLGDVGEGDVRNGCEMGVREAMALAAGRDRIALAYVTGYADIFEFALPLLSQARKLAQTEDLAVTTLHMGLLSRYLDSHLVRKFGVQVADEVRQEARRLLLLVSPVAQQENFSQLFAFDADLKAKGLNPGTTADFVVATLFAECLLLRVAGPRAA